MATGCRNRNSFEIHGSQGAIRFNLEDLNRLEVFDRSDAIETQGGHNVLVTGPGHPYVSRFWPPGHIIGYEHTFIHTIADFVNACVEGKPVQPTFEDGLKNQRVLAAVEESSQKGKWVKL